MSFVVTRYRNKVKRSVTFTVVTPLFLGGEDGKTAEIRIPSLRGVLRFWWRASFQGDLRELKNAEADVFGNTEKKSPLEIYPAEQINIKTSSHPIPKGTLVNTGEYEPVGIIRYLGYGLQKDTGGTQQREFIELKQSFSLEFLYPEHIEEDVERSLSLLHSFGGLGSRSRNGFGSVQIEGRKLLDLGDVPVTGEVKDYTSFSQDSRLFTFAKHDSWVGALSEAGVAYREARVNLEARHQGDRRRYVSLPLNIKGGPNFGGRHAKPYFLHVNKLDDKEDEKKKVFQSRILFLPYRYNYKGGQYNKYKNVCDSMNGVLQQKAVEVRDDIHETR